MSTAKTIAHLITDLMTKLKFQQLQTQLFQNSSLTFQSSETQRMMLHRKHLRKFKFIAHYKIDIINTIT